MNKNDGVEEPACGCVGIEDESWISRGIVPHYCKKHMKTLNKDFYGDLPAMVCIQLDDVFIPKFCKEEWFATAWEEYRQHIRTSDMETMMMPYSIFKKYIKEDA